VSGRYQPEQYWADRLNDRFDLRATGHIEYSSGYNAWLYRGKRRALRRLSRGVDPPADALDVGSGVGWVVHELREMGHRVDGCDIAPVAIERLAARFPDSAFFVATLGTDPLPREDASYDLITVLDVTYHITDDGLWEAGLADLARLLRPGGRIIVSDGLGSADVRPAEHVHFRSRDRWAEAAARHGLQLTRVLPYFRWLSRPRELTGWSRLPDGARGAVEYTLEWCGPRTPHMRGAALERPRDVSSTGPNAAVVS
jgi:SAM-dependent methyltransferase